MSSYTNNPYENSTFWTVYLIFGIGCIIFFFFGVCALLCCCRSRFRGVERKGYVIRDAAQTQPLIQPGMVGGNAAVMTGSYPPQQPYYPQPVPATHNPPQAPPPYDMPAKY